MLNPLQSVIGRDAARALTWDTTFFKLTHCCVGLMILRPGIGSHRNLGGGPTHSARIPETMWFNRENVWDSTTQTVYSVTCLSEIQLQIVPSYCSEYSHPSPPAFCGDSWKLRSLLGIPQFIARLGAYRVLKTAAVTFPHFQAELLVAKQCPLLIQLRKQPTCLFQARGL